MKTSGLGWNPLPSTVKSMACAFTPDQVTLVTTGPPGFASPAIWNSRENNDLPLETTRTVHKPGCDAGAKPAMGSCVVKHNSGVVGSSPYSAVVEMVPLGSIQSTRNWSPALTCLATNQRKAWRCVG